MSHNDHFVAHYVVLFTAQKAKKFKTWQDGVMKYYSFNRKLVLTDEKGYDIDNKTGVPEIGDEVEFEGHLVTVESFEGQELCTAAGPSHYITSAPVMAAAPVPVPIPPVDRALSTHAEDYRQARKRLRMMASSRTANDRILTPTVPRPHFTSPAPILAQTLPSSTAMTATTIAPPPPPPPPPQAPAPAPAPAPPAPTRTATAASVVSSSESMLNSPSTSPLPSSFSIPSTTSTVTSNTLLTTPSNTTFSTRLEIPSADKSKGKRKMGGTLASQLADDAFMFDDDLLDAILLDDNIPPSAPVINTNNNAKMIVDPASEPKNDGATKRVRVGLSKRTAKKLHSQIAEPLGNGASSSAAESTFVKASTVEEIAEQPALLESSSSAVSTSTNNRNFKSPLEEGASMPLVLQYPSREKALHLLKTRTHPKRTRTVPTRFTSVVQYKDTFKKLINEHIQILLLNYAVYYHSFYENFKSKPDIERNFRSKGVGFYGGCNLKSDGRFHMSDRFKLFIKNREHHSKYSKDDIWIISKSPLFEANSTCLGRSMFYGPFTNNSIELGCLTPRDTRVATNIMQENCPVYALRTISANAEFMMLDALEDRLLRMPILPDLLADPKRTNRKNSKIKAASPTDLEYIRLTREDNIDVEAKLQETIERYSLNVDQASVLRTVAKAVIVCPGWNDEPERSIVLVHGVFGSGKSFLAAVLIIFLRDIIDTACSGREPDDIIIFKILVSSMTNVAVDRILLSLLKLGYDHFVRVGSMKKIAKKLLPYTAQAKISSKEELKELEEMLDDPQNSEEDHDLIASTIQRFRKKENMLQELQMADVVGTTCMASIFDIFYESKFPLVLLDEVSQMMEPMTMVPMARFGCNRLIMIGDPLQLPPTLATAADEGIIGQGLDKTLFDRMTELGYEVTNLNRDGDVCVPIEADVHLWLSQSCYERNTE
ncbi:AAA domain-containing protein [Radiomyces spectabilis]|uniref:AAA domain-containing protein n=1 Tax=Radiomyces spectabilis TaxID=64574 RepID=UPI00221E5D12|nr:AAA domain-containing protein [Radiomyces spectabilis]KAI8377463.1 AAA domain-containing protein [Radiomyces spectabilis]